MFKHSVADLEKKSKEYYLKCILWKPKASFTFSADFNNIQYLKCFKQSLP